MMNRNELGSLLASSMDPRTAIDATVKLESCSKVPGFCAMLIVSRMLTSLSSFLRTITACVSPTVHLLGSKGRISYSNVCCDFLEEYGTSILEFESTLEQDDRNLREREISSSRFLGRPHARGEQYNRSANVSRDCTDCTI